jgi:hypothetical protein
MGSQAAVAGGTFAERDGPESAESKGTEGDKSTVTIGGEATTGVEAGFESER